MPFSRTEETFEIIAMREIPELELQNLNIKERRLFYPSIPAAFFAGLLLGRELDRVIPFVYEMTPSSRVADV